MSCRNTIRTAAAIAALSFSQLALAIPITGTFNGLAEGWRIVEFGGPQVAFDNEPVTGSFSLETTFSGADVYPDTNSVGYFGWPVRFTVTLFGDERVFENEDQGFTHALILSESGQAQTAQLFFFAAYANANLYLTAPNGNLFTNFDPATFNPAAVSVAASSAQFSANTRAEGVAVRFTDIRFDGYEPQPLPEPGTLALFGLGLIAIGTLRRRPNR
jgi:hypothetical protein